MCDESLTVATCANPRDSHQRGRGHPQREHRYPLPENTFSWLQLHKTMKESSKTFVYFHELASEFLDEIVTPCIRVIKLMLSVDTTLGILLLVCWVFRVFENIAEIWVESRIHTAFIQLVTNAAPRKDLFQKILRYLAVKLVIVFSQAAVTRLMRYTERQIKKRMRLKMTVLLIDSFCSLDFVTQTDPDIVREFTQANALFYRTAYYEDNRGSTDRIRN
jgi:hypothetical protein